MKRASITAVVSLLAAGTGHAQMIGQGPGGYGGYGGWGWGNGMYWFPYLWIGFGVRVVVIAGVVVGVVYLVRALVRQNWRGSRRDESALDIIQKRYARGEITKEEYEEMKRNLG